VKNRPKEHKSLEKSLYTLIIGITIKTRKELTIGQLTETTIKTRKELTIDQMTEITIGQLIETTIELTTGQLTGIRIGIMRGIINVKIMNMILRELLLVKEY